MWGSMSERTPFIVGNWKMYKTVAEARGALTVFRDAVRNIDGVDCGVAPPFPALETCAATITGSDIALAGQNLYPGDEGAFTGEVSAPMLKAAGATHVIIGHSERRHLFGEDDTLIARKVKSAVDQNLIPILCVGETQEQRVADQTAAVVTAQLGGGLAKVKSAELLDLVVAYEPVWAIGTGKTASPEQAQDVHAFIRQRIAGYSEKLAAGVRILYGGSVKAANAAELFSQADIDGGLVGGASLDAQEFSAICRAAE